MTGSVLLRQELDKLNKLQEQIGATMARQDPGRRSELVQLRRQLVAQLAAVDAAASGFVAATGTAEDRERFREKFSSMRSAAAFHQAKWPAVIADSDNPDYRASALKVRAAGADFIGWIRSYISSTVD